jgi:hypothetical protein
MASYDVVSTVHQSLDYGKSCKAWETNSCNNMWPENDELGDWCCSDWCFVSKVGRCSLRPILAHMQSVIFGLGVSNSTPVCVALRSYNMLLYCKNLLSALEAKM